MSNDSSVLIIGASGNWGAPLVEEFIKQKSSFKRIAILARDETHAKKFSKPKEQGVEIVIGSFLTPEPYKGFNTVLCLVGNDLLRLQPAIIEAAVAAGVTHFYPSEWGADIHRREMVSVRYYRDKHTTRSHCDYVAKQNPKFRYTLFIIGMFTEYVHLELIGWDHEKRTAVVYGSPDARIGGSCVEE